MSKLCSVYMGQYEPGLMPEYQFGGKNGRKDTKRIKGRVEQLTP